MSSKRSYSHNQKLKEHQKYLISDVEYVYDDDSKQNKTLLGKGSFATVYLVRHKQTKKYFALKVVD